MKMLSVLILSLFVTGCATTVPPGNYTVIDQDVVSKDFDSTWKRISEYFGENNINIKAMEKESGLITAETTRFPTSFDCGSETYAKDQDPIGRFNVFATADGDGTRVRFTVDATVLRCAVNGYGQCVNSSYLVNCNSIGTLETSFYNYLKREK